MTHDKDALDKFLSNQKHLVENTLSLYAIDFALLPAQGLYSDINSEIKSVMDRCHIYLIGLVPVVSIIKSYEEDNFLCIDVKVGTMKYTPGLKIPITEGHKIVRNDKGVWFQDNQGNLYGPSNLDIMNEISYRIKPLDFKVLYIGQAFGKDGSRGALDRLREHSTLQKIALKGVPESYRLELVLLGIENGNKLMTEFNPFASNIDDATAQQRIKNGFDKLCDTTEAEKVTLYEAALIRYFQPQYNIQFKDSFPSTNLKVLNDCYKKDIRSLVAEIHFDSFPYQLYSDHVSMNSGHMAHFDLHSDQDRKSFFSAFREL